MVDFWQARQPQLGQHHWHDTSAVFYFTKSRQEGGFTVLPLVAVLSSSHSTTELVDKNEIDR